MQVRVYATPALLHGEDLDGATAIVIDALRMTSVAAAAIENGCKGILAVAEVEEARVCAREAGAFLGGERNALPITGFDFSNSPLEYIKERICDRRLVMSTTNGTRAIQSAATAKRLLLGAFVNASAVAERVVLEEKVGIICAGTQGAFTLEDALAAGAILWRLKERVSDIIMDDMALAALALYAHAKSDLHETLHKTSHYNRLQRLGLFDDLVFCLKEDQVFSVPERKDDGWFR